MGKVTLSPQNSSMISIAYKREPTIEVAPIQPTVIEVPMIQYIEKIIEVPVIEFIDRPIEILKEVIVEKIVERMVPSEPIIIEKIIEVQAYDLYDGAVIELDILRRKHRKIEKQNKILKILSVIITVVAIITHII